MKRAVRAIQKEMSLLKGPKTLHVPSVLKEYAEKRYVELEKILQLFYP
jgi:hypothetical protein